MMLSRIGVRQRLARPSRVGSVGGGGGGGGGGGLVAAMMGLSPMAMWNFDDASAPMTDATGNGHGLLAISGSPQAFTGPDGVDRLGSASNMQAYNVTPTGLIPSASGLTVAAAFKTNANDYVTVFRKGHNGDSDNVWVKNDATYGWSLHWGRSGASGTQRWQHFTTPDTTFGLKFIVCTFASTGGQFYMNGTLRALTNLAGPVGSWDYSNNTGQESAYRDTTSASFRGHAGPMAVWNTVLATEDIEALNAAATADGWY